MSAARAFLRPAMKRNNLRVEMKALATKILFEGSRAVGVEYVQNGKTLAARAGREVILCGGSINTPQLLQLSGIGPAALLGDLGIQVVRDNAEVGANLQDHQGLNYTWKARVPTLNQMLRPWWGKLAVGMRYLLLRDGPLSMSMNQGGGFFRTDPSRDATQHAALLPGLLDGDPEERRAADPHARPMAGLFDRPVQLPADQPRLGDDPLKRSARRRRRSWRTPIRPITTSPRCSTR